MTTEFKIGKSKEKEIIIPCEACPNLYAEIIYDKEKWMLTNLDENQPIFVNNKKWEQAIPLSKHDKIKIGNKTIYWSDYLYEGEQQELSLRDLCSYHGRINRTNFRALSLLGIGLAICVYLSPGLVAAMIQGKRGTPEIFEWLIQNFAPIIHFIGFSILGIVLILTMIKRMRDTRQPIWKVWIPIYNLKILYFEESKQ